MKIEIQGVAQDMDEEKPALRLRSRLVHGLPSPRWPSSLAAFTLIELLVVIAIIGILTSIAVPAIRGLGGASDPAAARSQLADDLAYARLRAINQRTTVYVVFVPPTIATNKWNALDDDEKRELDKVVNGQYTTYALFSKRSLGDQPGPGHARYFTEWKTLPRGVFISTNDFNFLPPNTWSLVPQATNRPLPYVQLPFPLARSKTTPYLPCIAFNYLGQLLYPGDQLIHLSKGSVVFDKDSKGKYILTDPAHVIETPKTNWLRNPYLRIDWVTGRTRTIQPAI